ncbi:hypothetical protein HPP92_028409 [Vanilla planifolia]|uniref:DUF8204 domain-containing protein n=1 Tax=Vanilla planifolia TaxID=51239 RepID=A0A835P7S7_VANPL|nr:hypothetical protein HPP92_028409 [Vanilla planifolia]
MEEPSGGGGGDQSKTPGVSSSYRESLARVASTTRQPSNPTLATLYVSASAGLFPQVPNYIVGESEMEATNDGLNLLDFKYACVGYFYTWIKNEDKGRRERISRIAIRVA